MVSIKNISGFAKTLFHLKVMVFVFFYSFYILIQEKMAFRQYLSFLKRLLYFLSRLTHNKYVAIGKKTRIGLYIPGFPSRAFYTACRKFAVFNAKLPCTTVLVSVTSACRFDCAHCYQKNDFGKDVEIDRLVQVVKRLKDLRIAFFNVEGGEPFLRYERLRKVCVAIDGVAEIWINSTGDAMELSQLKELKSLKVTAIMFSLHSHEPEKLNAFMRSDKAWDTMAKGVSLCHMVGIPVAFNVCLMKMDFYNGNFEKILDKAKELGGIIVQLIKPKPSGGWLDRPVDLFLEEDLNHVKQLVHLYNHDPKYRFYPSISAQIIEEDKRLFGCTAGGTDRFYINAKGDVTPCEFLNISFGNIVEEDFDIIYERMRNVFHEPGENWLCEEYSKAILRLKNQFQERSLPLNPTLSKKIYSCWDRGAETRLYKKIESLYPDSDPKRRVVRKSACAQSKRKPFD